MPEYPEIAVHAERLDRRLAGRTLESLQALSFSAIKNVLPEAATYVGQPLTGVSTRGKYTILEFEPATFLVHLMQGGRLVEDAKGALKPRNGLVRWRFGELPHLLLTEAGKERRAGVWIFRNLDEASAQFADLGPEAIGLSDVELGAILDAAGGARIHGVLRDQRQIAGLGRRLANEICWEAQISPFARAAGTDPIGLNRAIKSSIATSLADERTRDDMVGSDRRERAVHHRKGEPCRRCGDAIRSVEYNSHEVNYCPTCQTGGKVLADNTTSKFLR